jgi:hypothetical protein
VEELQPKELEEPVREVEEEDSTQASLPPEVEELQRVT